MSAPNPLEINIVQAFRKALYYMAPNVSVVAVPNGTYIASLAGRSKAKKEGLATGFPDCLILAPGKIAMIEFKRRGGKPSDNQAEWIDRLDRWGFDVAVHDTAEGAIEWLKGLGFPISGRFAA